MSDKMTCPVCDSTTSMVLSAVENGEPCPYCGTSADVILRVNALRERHAESELRAEVERLTVALARAEEQRNTAQATVQRVWDALAGSQP